MYCLRQVIFLLLAAIIVNLTGCGGSSSDGSFNPVPGTNPVPTSASSSPSFSNTSSASGQFTLALSVDRTSIDANVGQVLATATLKSSNGAIVSDLPVTFSVAAGPATVVPSLVTVSTDSNGNAMTIIASGDARTTTNVILMATATITGHNVRAYAPFQIVRGSGIITFVTTKPPSDPDGTLFTLDETVDASFANQDFEYMQQLPFKLTDANGNPRVGVPVTIFVDNQLTGNATTVFRNPSVITDSAGMGIFNVGVIITAPPQGVTNTDSIIYRAVTTETSGTPSLSNYAGFVVSLTTARAIAIAPNFASFGVRTDINFTVSGGQKPYSVSSSDSSLVSATLQADGFTVDAKLVDNSPWTGTVTISISDTTGKTATATVSR